MKELKLAFATMAALAGFTASLVSAPVFARAPSSGEFALERCPSALRIEYSGFHEAPAEMAAHMSEEKLEIDAELDAHFSRNVFHSCIYLGRDSNGSRPDPIFPHWVQLETEDGFTVLRVSIAKRGGGFWRFEDEILAYSRQDVVVAPSIHRTYFDFVPEICADVGACLPEALAPAGRFDRLSVTVPR